MKLYSAVITFLLLYSASADAQTDSRGLSAEINVSATVIQSIELITVQNIRLDNIEPENDQYYISPVNDINAGHMIANGNANADIRITYQAEQELTQTNGRGIINIRYQLSGNTTNDQITSEILDADNRNLNFNNQGRYFIWVGGTIFIDEYIPGNYEGEFTIEIEYI